MVEQIRTNALKFGSGAVNPSVQADPRVSERMAANVNNLVHEEPKQATRGKTSETGTADCKALALGCKQSLFTIGETALDFMALLYRE